MEQPEGTKTLITHKPNNLCIESKQTTCLDYIFAISESLHHIRAISEDVAQLVKLSGKRVTGTSLKEAPDTT